MNSPSPAPAHAHEDNLRRLLDQRAARADVHHPRFSSLTEFSDSPSIYSHPHFSPRPPHLDSSPPQFDFVIPPQYAQPSIDVLRTLPNSTTTDTHRQDSDSASSATDNRPERSPSPESIPPEDEEQEPRMSFLGPTMRFHSPAPWETEDDVKEDVEQEDDARSFVTKRSRSKTRGDGFMKTFGWSAPARATSAARPSIESTTGRDKTLADNQISPPPNLHVQPQSTSTAVLPATPSSRPPRPGLIFSRGRSRTVSHTATPDTSVPPPPPLSPGSVLSFTQASAASSVPTRSTSPAPSMYSSTLTPTDVTDASRPTSPLSLRGRPDFVHPYANPDLAYDASPVHTTSSFLPPSSLGRRMVVPSDSIATVSESGVSQGSSTLTPDSSMSSVTDYHADVLLKKVVGSVQGKVISSPLSVITGHQAAKLGSQPSHDKGQLGLPNHVPGWTELSVSPTFNLISLQEAQAQARERARTQTQAIPDAPFLQTEPPPRNNLTTHPGATGRLRSRTASTSSKAKVEPLLISNPMPLPHSGAKDSQGVPISPMGTHPHTIKHKKSGFMRLFNGKDKDNKLPIPSPPPAPPVAAPPIPRTPKISSARVPVPSLSPSLVSQSPLQLDSIVKSDGRENDGDLQDRGNTRRQGPGLSILTQDPSSGVYPMSSQSARPEIGNTSASGLTPVLALTSASAPPSTTAFSGLSLRPISSVFSAHFADHITVDSPPTSQTDSSGTTSSGNSSTLSPATTQRSSDDRPATEDDPYLIIQQLQEQMKSTRKAWQHQIWELEGQVRDLRAEIDGMRLKEMRGERCLLCGRSDDEADEDTNESLRSSGGRTGIVDRPRARTGVGTRFGAPLDDLY